MNVIVEPAETNDLKKIRAFTQKVGVYVDMESGQDLQYLMLKAKDKGIIGVLGVDMTGEAAIFRTLVIDSSACHSEGLFYLLQVAIGFAREKEASAVYFVTPASPALFKPLGFEEQALDEIPDWVQARPPFSDKKTMKKVSILMCPLNLGS